MLTTQSLVCQLQLLWLVSIQRCTTRWKNWRRRSPLWKWMM